MNQIFFKFGAMFLVPILSAWAAGENGGLPNGKSILERPGRVSAEYAAWNPAELKPIGDLLQPKIKLKTEYPAVEANLPPGAGVGRLFWMDDQFIITTIQADGQEARVQILDGVTGARFDYKQGQLDCYRDGKIIFHSGPASAFMRPDIGGGKYYLGLIGAEEDHLVWLKEGQEARKFTFNPDQCDTLIDPSLSNQKTEAIGGTFESEKAGKRVPVWVPIGLLPQHGFLALHLPTRQTIPTSILNHYAVHWFKPGSKPIKLELAWPEEVQHASRENWAPWLGRYILSGSGLRYSKAAKRIDVSIPPESSDLVAEGNVTLFDPKDGSLIKVPRPSSLLNQVQIVKAYATRAGILWQSHASAPWGAYISSGGELSKIAPYHIADVSVSPNGCHAAFNHYAIPGDFTSPQHISFIHFC